MKILVACEYSGVVRDAFIKLGHDVMSCDLLPTDAPGPDRWKERSKTFSGIGEAMANQWGGSVQMELIA